MSEHTFRVAFFCSDTFIALKTACGAGKLKMEKMSEHGTHRGGVVVPPYVIFFIFSLYRFFVYPLVFFRVSVVPVALVGLVWVPSVKTEPPHTAHHEGSRRSRQRRKRRSREKTKSRASTENNFMGGSLNNLSCRYFVLTARHILKSSVMPLRATRTHRTARGNINTP